MSRSERSPRPAWTLCLAMVLSGLSGMCPVRAAETRAARRERIESMDPAEKADLVRAQERFAALGPAEQRRLRELHETIEAHPHSEELWDVMQRYCEWVKTLTPYERAELRELPPAERIEKIKQLREEQARRRKAGWGGMRGPFWGDRLRKLTPQERERLMGWIDQHVGGNVSQFVDDLPEPRREKLRQELAQAKDDPDRRRDLSALLWVRWQLGHLGQSPPLDDSALQQLRSQLPSTTGQWLQEMSPDRQRRVVGGIIGAFLFIRTHEKLSEYLQNELSPDERDRLTNLPREEMQQELWRRYLGSKGLDMPPRFHGRHWPPGRFGPRPGGRRPHDPSRTAPPRSGPPPGSLPERDGGFQRDYLPLRTNGGMRVQR